MQPTASAAMATRPSSRVARNWPKPLPRVPSRLASGTRQSSKDSGWVSLACQPSLSYAGSAVKPGVPVGTMIVEISAFSMPVVELVETPVRAVTVTTDVMSEPELVMNCLLPLTTHSPSTRSALVFVAPASEPEPGSVRPKPARVCPATRSGSQVCFCSSVPNVRIGLMPRPTAASSVMPIDWSTRPISSIATHRLVKSPSSPAPPNSSGAVRPNSPSLPIFCTVSTGK